MPTSASPHAPSPAPTPSLPPASEHTFLSHDSTPLFYRAWLPQNQPSTHAVLLFHRGHEHSGRLAELAAKLSLPPTTALFAWDARGHGLSPGDRGYAPHLSTLVKDVHAFVTHLAATHPIPVSHMALLAHSVGSVIAAAWVHDFAPPIRGMVLVAPAFRVKLYIPFARSALRFQHMLKPTKKRYVKSYVSGKMLTSDKQQAQDYDTDPLISRQIAVNILLDLHDTSSRLLDDAGAITTPTLVFTAGKDYVVKNSAIDLFVDRLSSPIKNTIHFPTSKHAILNETIRDEAIAHAKTFLEKCLAAPAPSDTALQENYTRAEFQKLSTPRPPLSPANLNFALQRLTLKTFGKLSGGIALGWQRGFDSGESLDYVYENTPRGKLLLGTIIDYNYLQAIGWRGIRQRRTHIHLALDHLINTLHSENQPIHILDIAAGPGRYLLETLQRHDDKTLHATLRDWSETGIAQSRTLSASMHFSDAARARITHERADAFNESELAQLASRSPQPTIAIVSGLYELFEENAKILASLRGLYHALAPNSYLVYTNQPWHPQVEMIARVLINRDQKPWIMRRRTQAEMDRLAASAGFIKQDMHIDPWGIFTVSIARRSA